MKMKNTINKNFLQHYVIAFTLMFCSLAQGNNNVGNLLWQDNFNRLNPDTWHVDIGDGCDKGLCGWGNQELQWYAESNTYIADIPGEVGNKALVLEARDEAINGYAFTSGKVQSSNKVAVQYGMIEVRMQVPDLGIGLWPAAWMLGTTAQSWPAKGEIDIMEMGHKASARADAGFPNADINHYVGSNLIFYTEAACSEGNPTCAASTAWQNDNAHVSPTPLTNRFVTYRTYWTDTSIRFTVEDQGVEIDMYDAPFIINEESSEFQAPFYLLLNLAVGGNFTDAMSNNQVTANKPAKMYIDYIRVYELDGQGQVFLGNQSVPEVGTFGVFTDNTATNNQLNIGQDSDIYVWNQNSVTDGTTTAFEGDNVIAWRYSSSEEWFGGGINAKKTIDLSNFNGSGALSFAINIPADVSFKVGIADTYSNQHWVEFPANTTKYGLARNGDWATATIPAADIRGDLVALQSLVGMFYIASVDGDLPSRPFDIAIDNIVWTGGGEVEITDNDNDGVDDIVDNCANTPPGTVVDRNGCEVIIAIDTDQDGIVDNNDQCPDTPLTTVVDNKGCAIIIAQSTFIEAEDYTNFSDTTADNIGDVYRTDAVDIETTLDTGGGYNVGWIEAGETLEYTLILGAGTYALSTRVASQTRGDYTVSIDNQDLSSDSVATGGWQVFQTHELNNIELSAGEHTIKITAISGNFNINWINLALLAATPIDSDNDGVLDEVDQCLGTTIGTIVDETGCEFIPADTDNDGVIDDNDVCPNSGNNVIVDTTGCALIVATSQLIEAEDYTNFYDTTENNIGGQYRTDAVDIEVTLDSDTITNTSGGYNIGWIERGEMLAYTIELGAGTYALSTRVASQTMGTYTLTIDGITLASDTVATAGWQTFETHNLGNITLTADVHTLVVTVESGNFNLNWINLELTELPAIDIDNDGINDTIDQCLTTPANTNVDAFGCALVIDIDSDGVNDIIDQCLSTPANTNVDAYGCAVAAVKFGVVQTEIDAVNLFVNLTGWADVHYVLNGGNQQNLRMRQSDNQNIITLSGLAADDVIEYFFTYLDDDGTVKDSAWASFSLTNTSNDATNNNDTNNGSDGDGVSSDKLEISSANGILVGGAGSAYPGFSVYVFDNDTVFNSSNCNQSCAIAWPPVLVDDGFATGVTNLGTVIRNDGSQQATYNGRPLYFYANDSAPGQTNGQGLGNVWWTVDYGMKNIVPLFSQNTNLEQDIVFDRGDALVTRFADRGRDRHAKEDQFQIYDHYLTHYWTHRTAQFELVDYVAKGGSRIDVTFITEWKLGAREFRAWYRGLGTVAEYHGNFFGGGSVVEVDSGRYDNNFNKISDVGDQYRYQVTINDYRPLNWQPAEGALPLAVGQRMEFEVSQFLDSVPEGRNNYYGTTYLYIVGQGLVPWKTVGDFANPNSAREDSYPIAKNGWLGGNTTLPYNFTAEPDNHFMQMATNLSNINGQPFVLGRRVHHTDFATGQHDENSDNGVFTELSAKAGTHYINTACSSCHERNGRASVAEIGEPLDKWVVKVADENGQPDAQLGAVLQPNNMGIDPVLGEGKVTLAAWTESNGLRSPNYTFSKGEPARFSARLAPQLIGLGLLEAISESTLLERVDVNDANGDGISGKAQLSTDPETGETRLGRFGYKAAASSIKHQVANALNTDMGVMTSVFPTPDCGTNQTTCGNTQGSELADEHLNNLVKYIALLGVRAQRDLDKANVILGEAKFNDIGCESCHRDTMQTSEFAVLAELRNQTIRPFSDLLLHDMGPGLADNLGEGEATGAEWRTTPLWGLGLSACVTGGVTNPTGQQGDEICTPDANYLHDGRARTIEEAILWHGGEAENARVAYQNLSTADQNALLSFLQSL